MKRSQLKNIQRNRNSQEDVTALKKTSDRKMQ